MQEDCQQVYEYIGGLVHFQLQEFVNSIPYFISILLDLLVYFQLEKIVSYIPYFIGLISKTFVCAGVYKSYSTMIILESC